MRRLAAVFLPLLAVFGLALWRSYGPAPQGDAATAVLRSVAARAPHPAGSPANAEMRDRVMAGFRQLGYDATVQRRFVCNARIACATVENIIARLPGAGSGDAVLVVAHYDSVRAGPGVSDDAMGVAALLETARAVRSRPLRNNVIFLVTDGEEAGLLGAEAFAADPALMREVAVVLNVENRGTYGASNMFETSRGNRWLIRHLASALPRPQATSLYQTVYDLLPNDTDASVFKRDGKAVLNFAAIRGVHWYHTPMDDLAHASPRTLQHHRENLTAMVRALGNADLAARSNDDAVYFDVLGFFLVWWPARLTVWIAAASLILLVVGAAARRTNPRAITFGVLATFAAILIAALAGAGISWMARLRSEGVSWVAYPAAPIAAMWLTGTAAAMFGVALFRRFQPSVSALQIGTAMVFHAAAVVLALTLPGPSFLFLVPAVLASLFTLIGADERVVGAVAATGAAVVIFPMGLLLYDALGARLMSLIAVLISLVAIWIAPLLRGAAIVLALAVGCAVLSLALPPYTAERPQFTRPGNEPPRMQVSRTGNTIRIRSLEGPRDLRVEVDRPVLRVNGVAPAAPTRRKPRPAKSVLVMNAGEAVIELQK